MKTRKRILLKCDRSLLGGNPCTCNKLDDCCVFPTLGDDSGGEGGVTVPHHSYCKIYKAARRCYVQQHRWLECAQLRRKPHPVVGTRAPAVCRCCKYCPHLVSMSGHCRHCPIDDRFMAAQEESLKWKALLHKICEIPYS